MAEKRKYSQEICDAVREFIEKEGFHFFFDEEEGEFDLSFKIAGKAKYANITVRLYDNSFEVIAHNDGFYANFEDTEEMLAVAKYIALANRTHTFCFFDLDHEDGRIRLVSYTDCIGGVPSEKVISRAIGRAIKGFERYATGFLEILYGGHGALVAFDSNEYENGAKIAK